jgi:methyl-accepting chemotaxis protein
MTVPQLSETLEKFGIDSHVRQTLADFWPTIEKHLPAIMEKFYQAAGSWPETQGLLVGKSLDILKKNQTAHWFRLFNDIGDPEYFETAVTIGQVHARIGLRPLSYVAGYNLVQAELTKVARKANRFSPAKMTAIIDATQRVVLMDMSLALTAYETATDGQIRSKMSEQFADGMLDQVVNLIIGTNEASIQSARMLGELAHVDKRAQQAASATEEMTASVRQISERTVNVSQLATETFDASQEGTQIVSEATARMGRIEDAVNASAKSVTELEEASERIAQIVGSIEDIAQQTNLLALNATIEAARAGEAGKGFAVVASEVKDLANQTERATLDIGERIGLLRTEMNGIVSSMDGGLNAVRDGVEVMGQVNQQMIGIGERVNQTRDTIQDVSGILEEQSKAGDEVAEGISAIAHETQFNSEGINKVLAGMDHAQGFLLTHLNELIEEDIPNKVIRVAKADHVMWKKRLADMAAGIKEMADDELKSHHHCRLGNWYESDASLPLRGFPAFEKLEEPHRRVHEHGIAAVQAHRDGNVRAVASELEMVAKASEEVLALLDQLDQESRTLAENKAATAA